MPISRIYKRTAGQLIEEALRDARIIPAEQPVNAIDYENGLNALNNVSKALQAEGTHLWLLERAILPLNPGQKHYSLGPDGAPCGYECDFYDTKVSEDMTVPGGVLKVSSTDGFEAPTGILYTSPVLSTADWNAINAASLSASGGLVVANTGATAGGAEYTLPATRGNSYRVHFDYTKGTSAGCTFSLVAGGIIADTVTLTSSDSGYLEITAELDSFVFRVQNTSAVAAQTSTVAALQYADVETGSKVGIQLDSGVRLWTYLVEVVSDTELLLKDDVTSEVSSGNTVYAINQQIDRPLQLFNATYASASCNSEIPVNRWSRQEYTQQPDKNSRGSVVNWYYNPTLDDGKLYVWQVANNVNNVMRFDVRKPIAVYDNAGDVVDFPDEYYMYFKWAVAADLGPGYGVKDNRQILLEQKAQKFLELALGNDNELDSVFIAPSYHGG